jgi:hypothetical protein
VSSPDPPPFAAVVSRQETALRSHCLYIPPEIGDVFRQARIKRVIATLNGRPYRRAIINNADGEQFLLIGNPILRDLRVHEGEIVVVELSADPEPDRIDLGEEFAEVLELDEEAAARFYSLTPGMQRSIASYVTSAKRQETRIKRALELAHKLKTYTLYGDLHGKQEP